MVRNPKNNEAIQVSRLREKNILAIPNCDCYEFAHLSSIIRLEGWKKYTKIFLNDGRELLSSYNIGTYTRILDPTLFILTHKSHMVNSGHVLSYSRDGNLVLSDGSSVPVSRRKKEEFMSHFIRINGPE